MRFSDTLKIVTRNLKRRKGRTILTAIGVTIGTASIVAMMSLAIGLKENVVRSVNQFGNLTEIEVYPGYQPDNSESVTLIDDTAIATIKTLPGVTGVMPRIRLNSGQAEIEFGRKIGHAEVMGVDLKEADKFDYQMSEGKYLSSSNEAVVSYNLSDSLRDKEKSSRKRKKQPVSEPVDSSAGNKQDITIKPELMNKTIGININKMNESGTADTRQFKVRVVGVLTQSQRSWGGGIIHLPMETVAEMNKWAGGAAVRRNNKQTYENILVKVPDRQQVENVVNQIKAMGYNAFSPITELQEVNKVFLVVQVVLGGIGAISLLVATIGIINTMVMSILERTREIGIMKVLGATIPNIRHLFLLEAGTIGFIGGVAGLVISYTISGIINLIYKKSNFLQIPEDTLGNIAIIPVWLALFALAFSSIVGVLAGIYPALRAAKLSPLNAIRQE